jgi:hypothetical protein
MFPLAARVTGDCDEEQSVIQPSRTLKKYIQLWWQIKRTKSSQDTLMRYTIPVIRNLVHYIKKTHKQASTGRTPKYCT